MSIPLVAAAVVATLVACGAAAAQQTTAAAPPATAARTGSADNGKKLFVKYGCYECHGREGQGGVAFGPRLAPNPMVYAAFVRYVRAPRGDMPPYSDKLITSEQDLVDIHAFLASRPPVRIRHTEVEA
jgi:ubiquinol-cytochrome c reductase cytochrome c subunit